VIKAKLGKDTIFFVDFATKKNRRRKSSGAISMRAHLHAKMVRHLLKTHNNSAVYLYICCINPIKIAFLQLAHYVLN
jgi:hypothetical protein